MLEFSHSTVMTEVDSRPAEAEGITRRHLLQGGLLVALACKTDALVTDELWPASKTELFVLDGPDADNGWLAVPGFGSIAGEKIAHQVRDNNGIPKRGPIGSYIYGNEVVTVDEMAEQARAYVGEHGLASLSFYCHSMGGVTGLAIARKLGLPIRDIVFNGSPYDISDAREGVAAQAAAIGSRATGYRGSFTSKFIGSVVRRFSEQDADSWSDVLRNISDASHDATSGAAPFTMGSQLVALEENTPTVAGFNGVIVPGFTRGIYCHTADPEADQVVHDMQAYGKYSNLFAAYGVHLEQMALPEPKHANTVDAMRHTADFLMRRTVELDDNPAAQAALALVQHR